MHPRRIVPALLVAVFLLRVGLAWWLPNIHQADEVYQVAEQANRAVNGYGLVSWEFQTKARGAFFPALVKPIYRVNASPAVHQALTAALFTAVSLIPVWVAFQWGTRLYGLAGGVLAAAMLATWFELVYFAPKPTPDAVAGYFLLAAVFLGGVDASRRALFAAGFCLAFAATIRMQIAPAAAVAFVTPLVAATDRRTRLVLLFAGALAGIALVGAVEWAWWGVPFRGHWGYLVNEFVHHASSFFKSEAVSFYLKNYVLMFGGAVPVFAFLLYTGARREPVLLFIALAVILPFHMFSHKEYRFLVTAVPLLVMLMALGTAELLVRFGGGITLRSGGLVFAAWLCAMVSISLGDQFRPYWFQDRNHILAFRSIGAEPDACGVALVGIRWYHTPGYSGLGRDIPLYESGREPEEVARVVPSANYVLTGPKSPEPGGAYVRWKAYSRPVEFLYRRPGGCVRNDAAIVQPAGIPGIPQ